MNTTVGRPIKLSGMAYAPRNEHGVVFLFGRLAPKIGFHIESVQMRFPDCVAIRRGKRYRIEIEYRASSFETHKHDPNGADIIVCWENDWEHRPKQYSHLEIIDLKKYTGATPRVYAVGCDENARGWVADKYKTIEWSVPISAQVGDLILMYRTKPASEIRDLWKITGPFYVHKKWGLQAHLKKVVALSKPLTFKAMKSDQNIRQLSVIKKQFTGKSDVTDDWPFLHELIIKLNPKAKAMLRPYHFD